MVSGLLTIILVILFAIFFIVGCYKLNEKENEYIKKNGRWK